MGSVTFTTDDSNLQLLTEAACALYGYQATVPDPNNPGKQIPNPQTPAQFAQSIIIKFCQEIVKTYQANVAAEAARQQALASVDSLISTATVKVTTS